MLQHVDLIRRCPLASNAQWRLERAEERCIERDAFLAGKIVLCAIATAAIEKYIESVGIQRKRCDCSAAASHKVSVLPTPRASPLDCRLQRLCRDSDNQILARGRIK